MLHELFSATGSHPLGNTKVINQRCCKVVFDRQLRCNILVMEGEVAQSVLQIPKEDRPISSLQLHAPLLTIQLCIPSSAQFCLDIVISQSNMVRMKLSLATYASKHAISTVQGMAHARCPLNCPRNVWCQVAIHIPGTLQSLFNVQQPRWIDTVTLCGGAKVRRIFGCHDEKLLFETRPPGMALVCVPALETPGCWSGLRMTLHRDAAEEPQQQQQQQRQQLQDEKKPSSAANGGTAPTGTAGVDPRVLHQQMREEQTPSGASATIYAQQQQQQQAVAAAALVSTQNTTQQMQQQQRTVVAQSSNNNSSSSSASNTNVSTSARPIEGEGSDANQPPPLGSPTSPIKMQFRLGADGKVMYSATNPEAEAEKERQRQQQQREAEEAAQAAEKMRRQQEMQDDIQSNIQHQALQQQLRRSPEDNYVRLVEESVAPSSRETGRYGVYGAVRRNPQQQQQQQTVGGNSRAQQQPSPASPQVNLTSSSPATTGNEAGTFPGALANAPQGGLSSVGTWNEEEAQTLATTILPTASLGVPAVIPAGDNRKLVKRMYGFGGATVVAAGTPTPDGTQVVAAATPASSSGNSSGGVGSPSVGGCLPAISSSSRGSSGSSGAVVAPPPPPPSGPGAGGSSPLIKKGGRGGPNKSVASNPGGGGGGGVKFTSSSQQHISSLILPVDQLLLTTEHHPADDYEPPSKKGDERLYGYGIGDLECERTRDSSDTESDDDSGAATTPTDPGAGSRYMFRGITKPSSLSANANSAATASNGSNPQVGSGSALLGQRSNSVRKQQQQQPGRTGKPPTATAAQTNLVKATAKSAPPASPASKNQQGKPKGPTSSSGSGSKPPGTPTSKSKKGGSRGLAGIRLKPIRGGGGIDGEEGECEENAEIEEEEEEEE